MTDAILGSYWTLAAGTLPLVQEVCDHDFRARVEAASKAGYTGMGFWHSDLENILKSTDFAEMRRILTGNGIVHIEVEWLNDWYYRDERRAESDRQRALLLDAAEGLGAHHIKVADLGNDGAPLDLMMEEFATLCAQAAERGTGILFEMLPADFSALPSIGAVQDLVCGAGAKNGGIMLDNLHVQRTGTSFDEIRELLSGDDFVGVEINDGMLARPVDFMSSVVHRRLLPGDGEFDIGGFLNAVWSTGFAGAIGVEVMNEYLRQWPLEALAETSFAKTKAVVDAARATGNAAS